MLPLQILVFLTCCLLNTLVQTAGTCPELIATTEQSSANDGCDIGFDTVKNDELVEADKTQAQAHIKGAHAYFSRRFFEEFYLNTKAKVRKQIDQDCKGVDSWINAAVSTAQQKKNSLPAKLQEKKTEKNNNNLELASHNQQYKALQAQDKTADDRIKATNDTRKAAYILSSQEDKNKFWRKIFVNTFVDGAKVNDKCVASFQHVPLDLNDPRYINEIKAVLKIFSVGDPVSPAPLAEVAFLRQVLVQSSLDSETCEAHKHERLPETIANAAYDIIQETQPDYLDSNAYTLACQLKLLSLELPEELPSIPKSVFKSELRSHFAANKFILGVSKYSEFVKKCKEHVNKEDNHMAWVKDFEQKKNGSKDAAVDCHCQLFLNEWLDELFVPHDEYSELGIFMILVPLGLCIFLIFYFTFHFCRR